MKRQNNKKDVRLSVVIPVYNAENYLDRCLRSVVNQTYPVDEIICVDDGSTDKSLEILRRYSDQDSRFKIFSKDNGGVVSAKKAGVREAKGDYIACIDSDDWIESNMYAEMLDVMLQNDADIVTSGCIRDYDGAGQYCVEEFENTPAGVYEGLALQKKIWEKLISTQKFFESALSFHIVTNLYKRDLLQRFQEKVNDEINIGDDAAVVYPCIINAKRIVVTGRNYYHYCYRDDSVSGRKNILLDENKRFDILFSYLRAEFQKRIGHIPNVMAQMDIFETYIRLFRQPEAIISYKDGVLYPYGEIPKGSRVVLYGVGKIGNMLRRVLEYCPEIELVACVDKVPQQGVVSLEELGKMKYDKVLIGVLAARLHDEIKMSLYKVGVSPDQIMTMDVNIIQKSNSRSEKDKENG